MPRILLVAAEPGVARRWAAMLERLPARVWLDRSEMPPDQAPEVILADSSWQPDEAVAAGEVALVRIGLTTGPPAGPLEVRLPEDASARELQLACRLLAEIVRLRRQHRDGAELRQRLSREALTDPLTGLPNRRDWDRVLAERLAAPRPARRLCLAILDLDHFKHLNDAHGHAVGDVILQGVGQAVLGGLRQEDFVARLGGDEFGLLLSVPDEAAAAAAVERVRSGIPADLLRTGRHAITASAGFCVAPPPATPSRSPSAAELFADADAALRAAKQQGRNRTVGGMGSAPRAT